MKTILFLMSGYSQAEKRGRDEILRFARTTDGLPPLDNHNPDSTISQLRDGRLIATPRLPDGMKAAEWPIAE